MATLNSNWQCVGVSTEMKSSAGYKYYLLLFAATDANDTTGIHKVTILGRLASTTKNATFYTYSTSYSGTINGATAFSGTGEPNAKWEYNSTTPDVQNGVNYYTYTDIAIGSVDVDCTDGLAKTINVSFKWSMPSGDSASYTPPAGTSRTVSVNVTLPAIPRASQPRLSISTVKMGNKVAIYTDRKSSSFTHTLRYHFGSKQGTIATSVADSYEWTVPDLANQLGNAVSGYGTIYCDTYSGTTKVGTKSVAITLAVHDTTEPTLSKSTVQMGGKVTIYTSRRSSAYTCDLYLVQGGNRHLIKLEEQADSYEWTVGDLAHLCNNATSLSGTILCRTFIGSASSGWNHIGDESVPITLTVPNATVPSLPNGNVILGSGNPIITTAASANFSHRIIYKFNGKEGEASNEWWATYDLASAIPSDIEGYGTITCETFNGSARVGEKSIEFKAIVPDNSITKPKFTGFNPQPSGNLDSVFDGLHIQGKTGTSVNFYADSDYSSIASYKLSVDGRVYEGDPAVSNPITRDGNVEVIGTVTDARGFSTSRSTSVYVLPYKPPKIIPYDGYRDIICERCDADGNYDQSGNKLRIAAKRSYYPIDVSGTQRNFCSMKLRIKETGGQWIEKELLSGDDLSTDTVNVIIPDDKIYPNFEAETDKSYLVQLVVTDTIGEEVPYEFTIPTDNVTLHLGEGGYGVAVGKFSEATATNKMFESGWNAKFYKDVIVDGNVLIGENQITLRDYILNTMNGG